MTQTEKIYELCKSGKYVCQTVFWANFIRYPDNRRKELVNQLNRNDEKYLWKWDIPKPCNCIREHKQCLMHRLKRTKL